MADSAYSTGVRLVEPNGRFNLSNIMKKAWEHYRSLRQQYGAWQIERGIVDASFSACLKFAWKLAKKAADAAKLQRHPNAGEITYLKAAIDALQYRSFRYTIEDDRRRLQARLSSLIGEAA